MENKNGEYLYSRIYSELKQELIEGKYEVGDPFPPERSLKERFSTTHITVRNALSRLVEEGYIERFSGKGTFVTYTGSEKVSNPISTSVSTVNMIAGSFSPLFTSVVEYIEPVLKRSGIHIMVHMHRDDPAVIQAVSRTLTEQPECICLWFFMDLQVTAQIAEMIAGNSVIIAPAETAAPLPQVICDISIGCTQAVQHLTDSIEGAPAYIGDTPSFGDRLKQECFPPEVEPVVAYSGGTSEGGYQACGKVLVNHPDCRSFFCASDIIASGVFRLLRERGLDEGTGFRIAGFGATPLAEALEIPSVELDHEKISQVLLQHILDFSQSGKLTATAARVKTALRMK